MSYRWANRGDLNAFFGLIIDNIAVLVLLVVLVTDKDHFSAQFVVEKLVPGTALGVLLGDLVYTWLAFRLARQTGRADVTAMPLGLDTPSTIGVGLLVLLDALRQGRDQVGLDHDRATGAAWHVGVAVLVRAP